MKNIWFSIGSLLLGAQGIDFSRGPILLEMCQEDAMALGHELHGDLYSDFLGLNSRKQSPDVAGTSISSLC